MWLARTASRSILVFMNEMAVHRDYAVADVGGLSGCEVGALTIASGAHCTTAAARWPFCLAPTIDAHRSAAFAPMASAPCDAFS
jgi:hypothetical protein